MRCCTVARLRGTPPVIAQPPASLARYASTSSQAVPVSSGHDACGGAAFGSDGRSCAGGASGHPPNGVCATARHLDRSQGNVYLLVIQPKDAEDVAHLGLIEAGQRLRAQWHGITLAGKAKAHGGAHRRLPQSRQARGGSTPGGSESASSGPARVGAEVRREPGRLIGLGPGVRVRGWTRSGVRHAARRSVGATRCSSLAVRRSAPLHRRLSSSVLRRLSARLRTRSASMPRISRSRASARSSRPSALALAIRA